MKEEKSVFQCLFDIVLAVSEIWAIFELAKQGNRYYLVLCGVLTGYLLVTVIISPLVKKRAYRKYWGLKK